MDCMLRPGRTGARYYTGNGRHKNKTQAAPAPANTGNGRHKTRPGRTGAREFGQRSPQEQDQEVWSAARNIRTTLPYCLFQLTAPAPATCRTKAN